VHGPNPTRENTPNYLDEALAAGFDVELDVWSVNGRFVLGHDAPEFPVAPEFLTRPGLWCHAKDPATLLALLDLGAHCFFHDTDAVTLTSRGYLWTYPGASLTPRSVCVMPERVGQSFDGAWGVCSDYVALAPAIPR